MSRLPEGTEAAGERRVSSLHRRPTPRQMDPWANLSPVGSSAADTEPELVPTPFVSLHAATQTAEASEHPPPQGDPESLFSYRRERRQSTPVTMSRPKILAQFRNPSLPLR